MISTLAIFLLILVIGAILLAASVVVWPVTILFALVGLALAGVLGMEVGIAMAGVIGLIAVGWQGGKV